MFGKGFVRIGSLYLQTDPKIAMVTITNKPEIAVISFGMYMLISRYGRKLVVVIQFEAAF